MELMDGVLSGALMMVVVVALVNIAIAVLSFFSDERGE